MTSVPDISVVIQNLISILNKFLAATIKCVKYCKLYLFFAIPKEQYAVKTSQILLLAFIIGNNLVIDLLLSRV